MNKTIKPRKSISGIFSVPGDKSISHRAVMLGSIARGKTEINGFSDGADCRSTISCFEALGIQIEQNGSHVTIFSDGKYGLKKPSKPLDCGNSATTLRMMAGLLAAQDFTSVLTGDESLRSRPMRRVALPLGAMGAKIIFLETDGCAPIEITGSALKAARHEMNVASAQVKSAILLAGLYADGETVVVEPERSRDHTEIMMNYLSGNVVTKFRTVTLTSSHDKELIGRKFIIPGDISSAAYLITAALILPDSEIILTNIGVNITRTGFISALKEMGANIEIMNRRLLCGEWVGDIKVKSSVLYPTTIQGTIIPRMIDEIPVFAVVAAFARGKTVIKDASELKVKESNRINAMVTELKKMGVDIEETEDGMIINGGNPIKPAKVFSHNDHRVAMSLAVAALACNCESEIENADCIDISFPDFFNYMERHN